MTTPTYYIGIDIGATLIKAGIVKRDGTLVSKEEQETEKITGPAHFVKLSEQTISRLLRANSIAKRSIGGVGVGAPGWVDHDGGIVHELTNMSGWSEVPIPKQLEEATGLNAFVDNDANVMAVGELLYGAGREHRNIICLTLGTGVGGAVVINGEVYRGAHGLAGEIGHMTIDANGPRCACGANGCLERYVGNRFIVAEALKRIEEDPPGPHGSILLEMSNNRPMDITPKMLAQAADKGDEIAIEVWHETGHRLGIALAVLVNILNPECFIIGGGVAQAGTILFEPMRSTMASLAMNRRGEVTPILQARLGKDAGIIGAAALAFGCIEQG